LISIFSLFSGFQLQLHHFPLILSVPQLQAQELTMSHIMSCIGYWTPTDTVL